MKFDMTKSNALDAVALAQNVIATEIEALQGMSQRLNGDFRKAVDIILEARGRVVVVGMGKSGLIGQKIVATLASMGTPAFSVHPGEAFHGDLGMIKPIDVVLMISNSGETEELIRLLPFMAHQKNPVIAMTGKLDSTLAKHAHVVLDISVPREACNNNLAPTSSTTATLVMGDALSVVLSTLRGFQPEDFARFHPGGSLGRKLLTRVSDVMRKDRLPTCALNTPFKDLVHTMTDGRLGLAAVMDGVTLVGIVTDGDVRRAFDRDMDHRTLVAGDIMSPDPKTVGPDVRFAEAEETMRAMRVNSLLVVDEERALVGVLQIFSV